MTRRDAYSIIFFNDLSLERGSQPGRHCRILLRNRHHGVAIILNAERMSALFEAVGHKQSVADIVPEAEIEVSGDYRLFAHDDSPPSGAAPIAY